MRKIIAQFRKSKYFSNEEKEEIIARLTRIQKSGKYLYFAETLESSFDWRAVEGGYKYWWVINKRL
jgi:hypothetical protein